MQREIEADSTQTPDMSPALAKCLAAMATLARQPIKRNIVIPGAFGFLTIVPSDSPSYARHEKALREQGVGYFSKY
jgi:hypothetical protein